MEDQEERAERAEKAEQYWKDGANFVTLGQ
jgi:hypothetical protein